MTSFVALGKCVNFSSFQFPLLGKKKKGNINTYLDYLSRCALGSKCNSFYESFVNCALCVGGVVLADNSKQRIRKSDRKLKLLSEGFVLESSERIRHLP